MGNDRSSTRRNEVKKFATMLTAALALVSVSGCAQLARVPHGGTTSCNSTAPRYAYTDKSHRYVVTASECDLLNAGFKPSEILKNDPLKRVWVMVKNPYRYYSTDPKCIQTTEQVRREEGWELC
jgi:hypothetical protein